MIKNSFLLVFSVLLWLTACTAAMPTPEPTQAVTKTAVSPTVTPTPIPTAMPERLKPAADGEALIIIVPVSNSSDVHHLIYEAIEEQRQEIELDKMRVEIDPYTTLELSDQEAAQALGEEYDASIVIWGEEGNTSVKVNALNINEPEVAGEYKQVEVIAPNTLIEAELVEEHMREQVAFLSSFTVGQAVVAQGDLAEALPIFEAAIDSIPEESLAEESALSEAVADAYFWLGWLYFNPPNKNYLQAAIAYEQSLVFKSENAATLNNLGITYRALEEYEPANEYYKQALTIAQENED